METGKPEAGLPPVPPLPRVRKEADTKVSVEELCREALMLHEDSGGAAVELFHYYTENGYVSENHVCGKLG